ncbi:MAG: nuclear transport factor 2 family protein [Terriglobales bacterium]
MKTALITAACLLLLTMAPAQEQKKHPAASTPDATALEGKIRKVWEDFKNKNKAAVAAILAGGFRELEEDGSGFGDNKALLAMIDAFELTSYNLKDLKVQPLGKGSALVTYLAHYEGKAGGQPIQSNTGYGEVWVHQGNGWKLLYVQETNIK